MAAAMEGSCSNGGGWQVYNSKCLASIFCGEHTLCALPEATPQRPEHSFLDFFPGSREARETHSFKGPLPGLLDKQSFWISGKLYASTGNSEEEVMPSERGGSMAEVWQRDHKLKIQPPLCMSQKRWRGGRCDRELAEIEG